MISEFALDPELVAGWHDPREWAYFQEAFWPDTGRVGSSFPSSSHKKWGQAVIKAFNSVHPGVDKDSFDRRRIDEIVNHFAQLLVLRDAGPAGHGSWVEAILKEHDARPFHGILSGKANDAIPEWITPQAIYGGNAPHCWTPPSNQITHRSPGAMAKIIEPLLVRSCDVTFVDPWFKFAVRDKPQLKTHHLLSLEAMLAVFWGEKRCVAPDTVSLILLAPKPDSGVKHDPKRTLRDLIRDCEANLPSCIPAGREMSVMIVKARPGGERFHNRYILTTLAGVIFGTGLDAGWGGETDDVCRLSREQYKERYKQYVTGITSFFDIVEDLKKIKSDR